MGEVGMAVQKSIQTRVVGLRIIIHVISLYTVSGAEYMHACTPLFICMSPTCQKEKSLKLEVVFFWCGYALGCS